MLTGVGDRLGEPAAGSRWAVETRGLTKRFGAKTAVNGVDLLVPRGSAFGYLGPNGAGKTTLLRILLGLTKADAGTMSLLGYPVPRHRDIALARVGAIVDEPRFHRHLTGRENLRLLAAARERAARDRIGPALERVGLAHRADDLVAEYSMGMRQRLGVAACLLGDPQLLLLDEPMNGLDPAGIAEMRLQRSFVAVAMVRLQPSALPLGFGLPGLTGGVRPRGQLALVPESAAVAVFVVVAWVAGWAILGAWRMATRDT